MGEQATKREPGRPTSYRAEFCEAIQSHAELLAEGATDTAIAAALSVDVATIYRWKEAHPEFGAACAAVKETADDRVEASLFKRGIGYSHQAVKIFMPAGAQAPVFADYTERYPPETAAASLWLRNRRPAKWRDRIEHTGADGKDLPAPTTLDVLEIGRLLGFALRLADERRRTGDGAKLIEGHQVAEEPEATQRANLGQEDA